MKHRDPVLARFGQNVLAYREQRKLTQEALAEKADIDRTYLSDIERGIRNAGVKNIARLARALEIDAAKLMEGIP